MKNYKSKINLIFFLVVGALYSCENEQGNTDTNPSPEIKNLITQRDEHSSKAELRRIKRAVQTTLETNQTSKLFNDSLSITLNYFKDEFPNNHFLYILSEEIGGESRKWTNIKVNDTFEIINHAIIVEGKKYKESNANASVNLKVIEYESNE